MELGVSAAFQQVAGQPVGVAAVDHESEVGGAGSCHVDADLDLRSVALGLPGHDLQAVGCALMVLKRAGDKRLGIRAADPAVKRCSAAAPGCWPQWPRAWRCWACFAIPRRDDFSARGAPSSAVARLVLPMDKRHSLGATPMASWLL